jgi:anti-sigma regulatory factor (Ser/Thr protein kinase)
MSSIESVPRLTMALPAEAGVAGRRARAVLASYTGRDWQRFDDAQLALTEIVSNACVHGRGKPLMQLWWDAGLLRAEVTDDGPGFDPSAVAARPATDNGGRGLLLVETLSDRWGAAGRPTKVWFEIT